MGEGAPACILVPERSAIRLPEHRGTRRAHFFKEVRSPLSARTLAHIASTRSAKRSPTLCTHASRRGDSSV